MTRVTISVPEELVAADGPSADRFGLDLRIAAAVHWYSRGEISQGAGARLAGMTREEFIDELGRQGVDVLQVDAADLRRELGLA